MGHAQEIGLDDDQRNSIRNEVHKAQGRFLDLQFELQGESEKLGCLLQEKPVDESRVLAQIDRILALEKDVKRIQIALLVRIKNLLKPDQQSRLTKGLHGDASEGGWISSRNADSPDSERAGAGQGVDRGPRGLGPPAAAADRRAPVRLPPRRRHGRRALGHGRHRRQRDRDEGRDLARGRRRGHRLRHGARSGPTSTRGDCRTACTALAPRRSRRHPRRLRRAQRAAAGRGRAVREPRRPVDRRGAEASRRRPRCSAARSAAATTSSSSASTTTSRVWLMLHSGSRNIGKELGGDPHRQGQDLRAQPATCPIRDLASSWPAARALRRVLAATSSGRSATRYGTARSMLAEVLDAISRHAAGTGVGRRAAILCHHNYVARGASLRRDVLVTRKGAIRARQGRPRHHPGIDGHGLATSCAASGNRRVLRDRLRTARAGR